MNRDQIKKKLTKLELTFGLVMDRLKTALELGTDAELASLLGMSTSNYANRKRVGSVPFDLIIPLCLSRSVSVDWICTGVGHPFTTGDTSNLSTPAAVKPVLLAQVFRELELAFDGPETAGVAGKIGFMAGVVYNAVAGERDQAAQAAKLREQAELLASVDKIETQVKAADKGAATARGSAKPPSRGR